MLTFQNGLMISLAEEKQVMFIICPRFIKYIIGGHMFQGSKAGGP